jgi:hypothetical protein
VGRESRALPDCGLGELSTKIHEMTGERTALADSLRARCNALRQWMIDVDPGRFEPGHPEELVTAANPAM